MDPFYSLSLCSQPNDKKGFPGGSDGKESAWNTGYPGSTPGLGRFIGEGNGNPLQYSCLKNSMDRGAWWATADGLTELDMTKQLTLSLSKDTKTINEAWEKFFLSGFIHTVKK